ncbi:MAG: AtpZ/AtpI family protein [Rickettsiaceae bacterium]|nr:AtpZ/AtpI family protein [Rickettsiaceae bacterium]
MDLKKYNSIQKRIDKYKDPEPPKKIESGGGQAFNIAVELVAGMIVGVIMGLFFDNLFDSKPISLIICLVLAMVASFKSIWIKYVNVK